MNRVKMVACEYFSPRPKANLGEKININHIPQMIYLPIIIIVS